MERISDAPAFLVGVLGGVSGYGGPTGEYKFWNWDYPGGGQLEILEPEGPPGGFLHRFLERGGPGIHHITFHVDELGPICERARAAGHTVLDGRASDGGYAEAFLHPKTAMGVVVQLTKTHDTDNADHEAGVPGMDRPVEPAAAQPAARVLGLRMCATDRARALRQWRDLLGGRLVLDHPDELIFHWQSPGMRVRVRLDPAGADRSEAIEVADPPGPVPSDPVPLLCVRFDVVTGAGS
jgi:methylmalonyl-CoA/ethylmalonyl-CoA epimerase